MHWLRWTVCAGLRNVKTAISQKLADAREVEVSTHAWHQSYQAALLETDWTKMEKLIQTAEFEIHQRRVELSQDHGGTDEERAALVNAMNGLRVLRVNVASWLERQNLGGTTATKLRSQVSKEDRRSSERGGPSGP